MLQKEYKQSMVDNIIFISEDQNYMAGKHIKSYNFRTNIIGRTQITTKVDVSSMFLEFYF